jgi:hypothetical protein
MLIRASTIRSQHRPLPYTFPSSTTLINVGESYSSSLYLQYNKASKVQKPRRKANTTTQQIVVPATTRIFKQVFPITSYAMDTAQSFARATTAYIVWGEVNFCCIGMCYHQDRNRDILLVFSFFGVGERYTVEHHLQRCASKYPYKNPDHEDISE